MSKIENKIRILTFSEEEKTTNDFSSIKEKFIDELSNFKCPDGKLVVEQVWGDNWKENADWKKNKNEEDKEHLIGMGNKLLMATLLKMIIIWIEKKVIVENDFDEFKDTFEILFKLAKIDKETVTSNEDEELSVVKEVLLNWKLLNTNQKYGEKINEIFNEININKKDTIKALAITDISAKLDQANQGQVTDAELTTELKKDQAIANIIGNNTWKDYINSAKDSAEAFVFWGECVDSIEEIIDKRDNQDNDNYTTEKANNLAKITALLAKCEESEEVNELAKVINLISQLNTFKAWENSTNQAEKEAYEENKDKISEKITALTITETQLRESQEERSRNDEKEWSKTIISEALEKISKDKSILDNQNYETEFTNLTDTEAIENFRDKIITDLLGKITSEEKETVFTEILRPAFLAKINSYFKPEKRIEVLISELEADNQDYENKINSLETPEELTALQRQIKQNITDKRGEKLATHLATIVAEIKAKLKEKGITAKQAGIGNFSDQLTNIGEDTDEIANLKQILLNKINSYSSDQSDDDNPLNDSNPSSSTNDKDKTALIVAGIAIAVGCLIGFLIYWYWKKKSTKDLKFT